MPAIQFPESLKPFNLIVRYRGASIALKDVVAKKLDFINEYVNHYIEIGNAKPGAWKPVDSFNVGGCDYLISSRKTNCFREKADQLLTLYEKIINLLPPDDQDPYSQWLAEAKERRTWR
jgi:hypothetical protein